MGDVHDAIDVELGPDPRPGTGWPVSMRPGSGDVLGGESLDALRTGLKEELDLDPDRPVVVVGHQPVAWHPGILAKFLAADHVARSSGATLVHLVVDGHRGNFGDLAWPAGNEPSALEELHWQVVDADESIPMGWQPAMQPAAAPTSPPAALSSVSRGMSAIEDALRGAADLPSSADQFAAALDRLMDPWVGPRRTIMVSRLLETRFGRSFLGQMQADAQACRAAYDASLPQVEGLGISALAGSGDDLELPLWIETDTRQVRTARLGDLPVCEGKRLLPKALCLTAIARLGLADLFVHGLGGWQYDVAMESWISSWLGLQPSPRVMCTANLRLPLFPDNWLETRVTEAIADARRHRHDPETVEPGHGPGPGKAGALKEIDSAPRGSRARQVAYEQMHERLAAHSNAGDGQVDMTMQERLQALQSLGSCRTWSFGFYDDDTIASLRDTIAARFS